MKPRRLRLLLFSLFLTATIASALHTIAPHHIHDNCPICTMAEHTAAPDAVLVLPAVDIVSYEEPYSRPNAVASAAVIHFVPSRAPPLSHP